MERKTVETLEREIAAMQHLLDSRGKQIVALRERLEGEEEVKRLLVTFLPLLALAAARDGAANEAVRITGSKDVLSISIGKAEVAAVLGDWDLKSVEAEGVYRLAFAKRTREA